MFFGIIFVWILLVGHLISSGFDTVYQGEDHDYWSGNATMVTAVKGYNETFSAPTLYLELGGAIINEELGIYSILCDINEPEAWQPEYCFEFPESDN